MYVSEYEYSRGWTAEESCLEKKLATGNLKRLKQYNRSQEYIYKIGNHLLEGWAL